MDTNQTQSGLPSYQGIETIPWDTEKITFHSYLKEYYRQNGRPRITRVPSSFAECPVKVRAWIISHSFFGDIDAASFHGAIPYPVVNHETGKLNKHAMVRSLIEAHKRELCPVDIHQLLNLLYSNFPITIEKSLGFPFPIGRL